MRGLWDFLVANPILFFVLAAWIAGAIGNAVRARGQAQRRTERTARRDTPTRRIEPSTVQRQQPPPVPQQRVQQQRDADEVAAEMRRILGLDDGPPKRAPEVMPRSEPIRREPVRQPAVVEEPPTPLTPTQAARMLDRRMDSHVGEGISMRTDISKRKEPRTGRVGIHDREWGTLGGRRRDPVVQLELEYDVDRLVDLRDLKRVILGAEILGPPLALRDPDQQRMF